MAEAYLSKNFSDGIGHSILVDEAASSYDGFKTAFRFGPNSVKNAESSHNYNTKAQIEHLLRNWYSSEPTKKDLVDALTRWGHKKLMRLLNLNTDNVEEAPIAQPPKQPTEMERLLMQFEKMQEIAKNLEMQTIALTNNMTYFKRQLETLSRK